MSGLALSSVPAARSRHAGAIAVALSLLAGLAAALGVKALAGSSPAPAPHARPFAVAVPAGWAELPVAHLPSHPVAVLRRRDGSATFTIRRSAPVHATGAQLIHDVGGRLRATFPGFRPVSARFAAVRGGRAFVYTFVHGRTVQTLALVSAHGQAYAIDAVVEAGSPAAAREVGAMVRSFGP